MNRELTCIICPRGCPLSVEIDGENITVSGSTCPRGEKYAIEECTHPMRTVTSTVRVKDCHARMVSVKTATPIPKESIFELMKLIRAAEVTLPVNIGDVIIPDVFGTDIIAAERAE